MKQDFDILSLLRYLRKNAITLLTIVTSPYDLLVCRFTFIFTISFPLYNIIIYIHFSLKWIISATSS
jgi:hypothetical protein